MGASDRLPQPEADLMEQCARAFAATPDSRLRQLLVTLVRYLHAFVEETELTEAEWLGAIEFLTACGQTCAHDRQEVILLSDVLGVSSLVDSINHRRSAGNRVHDPRPVLPSRRPGPSRGCRNRS